MSYWDNFEEVQPQDYRGQFESVQPEVQTPAVSVNELKKGLTPWQRVGQGLKHDLEDIGYGMKKALSGATLGASDWALRKLGVTDDDYLVEREAEGLGNYVKGAGFVSELGGNMLGAGGALAKSLGKAGLKGLKLASTAGGLEGAAYGLTGSDSWSDVPQNVAIGAGFGASLPVGLHAAGYGTKWLTRPLTDKVTRYIGKQKPAKQLAKGAGFIASNAETVNPAFQRSFVEALADEGKRRTMRNAVLSGAEDLSERARILSDRMAARKNGMYDQAFEDIIIIPELKKAKDAYKTFMDKNGEKLLPEDAVSKFYAENPVAQGVLENAREINPSAFRGIKRGSLAEFDELKRLLNTESKNVMSGTSASVKDAYKRAGNELKTLMDKNVGGFRDVNTRMAAAQTAQDIFESKLGKGLTQVGGSTATTSPFWSGITSPLTAAGVVGGAFNPASLALTAGGLSAKALMRAARRNAGRRIADGVIRTPIEVNINPNLSAALSATALSNMFNR